MKITIPILIPVEPRTKKNSMRLVKLGGRIVPIPSKQYKDFEAKCGEWLQPWNGMEIDRPVNVRCLFYMKTRRKVDLTNLLEAADDVLVKYHVLADDNSQIVAGHDGSRVLYDKSNPRIEIDITEEV
ncbi:MAG: RusA family crossover junction endodeoxyribonuclease [Acidaminococcaceae bacterium]|nr:RusA family crossover junction endodeoxyribonuclease [Acidaminococcaceae bacterium]